MNEETMPILEEQPNFKPSATVHALLLIAAAYALVACLLGVIDNGAYPLLLMIAVSGLFLLTLVFGLLSGAKLNLGAIVALLIGVLQSVYIWLCGGTFLSLYVCVHLVFVCYAYFALALFGNHDRTLRGGLLLLDLCKATFVYPFLSFTQWFTALVPKNSGSKRFGKAVLQTLIGVVCAAILGFIVISLLSFDETFRNLVTISFSWDDVPIILLRAVLSVPCCALLYSVFVSSAERKLPGMSTPHVADAIAVRMKKLPAVVLLLPVASLLVIYGLFFFTQWDVYMSAFSGVLPASFTAAEYARSGFFELCGVAFINASLSIVMSLFMKEEQRAAVLLKKIANTLLALSTLILIATALSKMLLYIKRFDLTVLRLLTSVILVLIAIGFFVSLLSQWVRRIKVTPVLTVCIAALLLVVPFLNVRGRIAQYNVDSYLADTQRTEIDTDYLLYDLGCSGIPAAVRLLESGRLSDMESASLRQKLCRIYGSLTEKTDPFEKSLADLHAIRALEAAGCTDPTV